MDYYWHYGQIVKVNAPNGDVIYKILGSDRDEWRLNSGIVSYEERGDRILFKGYSGSIYMINRDGIDRIDWWSNLIDNWQAGLEKSGTHTIEKITFDEFKKEFDNV